MALEGVALRFAEFRRALREVDRRAFDRLVDRARAHSSAASYEASLDPAEVIFLSILLDQELEIHGLRKTLDEISWRMFGRPAASSETLDAYASVPGPAAAATPPPPASAADAPLKIQRDYIEKVGGGWEFTFKEDGRKSKAVEPAPEPAHARLGDAKPLPKSSDSV